MIDLSPQLLKWLKKLVVTWMNCSCCHSKSFCLFFCLSWHQGHTPPEWANLQFSWTKKWYTTYCQGPLGVPKNTFGQIWELNFQEKITFYWFEERCQTKFLGSPKIWARGSILTYLKKKFVQIHPLIAKLWLSKSGFHFQKITNKFKRDFPQPKNLFKDPLSVINENESPNNHFIISVDTEPNTTSLHRGGSRRVSWCDLQETGDKVWLNCKWRSTMSFYYPFSLRSQLCYKLEVIFLAKLRPWTPSSPCTRYSKQNKPYDEVLGAAQVTKHVKGFTNM